MEILSVAVLFLMFFGGYYFFGLNLTEKQKDNVRRNLPPDYDSGGGIPVDENDNPIEEKTNSNNRNKSLDNTEQKTDLVDRKELLEKIISSIQKTKDKFLLIPYNEAVHYIEIDDDTNIALIKYAGPIQKGAKKAMKVGTKIIQLEELSTEELSEIYNDYIFVRERDA